MVQSIVAALLVRLFNLCALLVQMLIVFYAGVLNDFLSGFKKCYMSFWQVAFFFVSIFFYVCNVILKAL